MVGNPNPEISLNKIDDFRGATEKQKQSILRNFKFPNENFRRSQYNSVKSALKSYLTSDGHDLKIFEEKRKNIEVKKKNTQWQIRDVKNSLILLKDIEKYIENLFGKYFKYILLPNQNSSFRIRNNKINGVTIHLNPDVLLFNKKSDEIIGAIKFVFSKSKQMTPMKGQIIAGLIKEYVEKKFKVISDHNNYLAFDVFHKTVVVAPSEFSYHKKLLLKAVNEINSMWSNIKEK